MRSKKNLLDRIGLGLSDFSKFDQIDTTPDYFVAMADEVPIINDYCKLITTGITEQRLLICDEVNRFLSENINTSNKFDLLIEFAINELGESEFITEFIEILGEKTYKDLMANAPDFLNVRQKSRAASQIPKYLGVHGDTVKWKIESYTKEGITYNQDVRLMDLKELTDNRNGLQKPIDVVRKAIQGNIEVHCTDPSWKYWGFQYIGTRDQYAIEPETRSPDIRNPQKKGSICKHLDAVLYVLPFWSSRITSDLKKSGWFTN